MPPLRWRNSGWVPMSRCKTRQRKNSPFTGLSSLHDGGDIGSERKQAESSFGTEDICGDEDRSPLAEVGSEPPRATNHHSNRSRKWNDRVRTTGLARSKRRTGIRTWIKAPRLARTRSYQLCQEDPNANRGRQDVFKMSHTGHKSSETTGAE